MTSPSSLELGSSSNTAYPPVKSNQPRRPQGKIAILPSAVIVKTMGFLPLEDFIACKHVFRDLTEINYVHWVKQSGYLEVSRFLAYLKEANKPFDATLKSVASFLQRLELSGLYLFWNQPSFGEEGILKRLFPPIGMNEDPSFPMLRKLLFYPDHFETYAESITSQAPKITHVTLADTMYEEIESLANFKRLESLSLEGGFNASDLDPEDLAKFCPNLKELELVGNREGENGIDFEACKVFAKVPQLIKAEITGEDSRELSDDALAAFVSHPNLRELSIYYGTVTISGLQNITKIPHLRELHFDKECFIKDTLECLASAKSLRKVSFHCNVASAHLFGLITSLEGAKNITELELFVGDVTSSLFTAIGKCTHLRHLTIRLGYIREKITDEVLLRLGSCQELCSLRMSKFDDEEEHTGASLRLEMTTQGVAGLVKKMPHLELLDLNDNAFTEINLGRVEIALLETRPRLLVKRN